MQNQFERLNNVKRPKILIRAARAGIANYQRNSIKKLIKNWESMDSNVILDHLISIENAINAERLENEPNYDMRQHITVLTAIMAEITNTHQIQCQPSLEYKMVA